MKDKSLIFILILLVILFSIASYVFFQYATIEKSNLVSYNGYLHVENSLIQNSRNETFQLKGISSHGIQWYSDIITYDSLKQLRDNFNVNVFRIAIYTEEDGYIYNKDNIKNKTIKIINDCIALDIYVVIDWHILSDGDPNKYINESNEFFNEISKKYKYTPNIIYEICNEPNGDNVSWIESIKPYAEKIISTIRKNSSSIIIVGTPTWSKNLKAIEGNLILGDNIMYAYHYYPSSNNFESAEFNLSKAIENNIPIFVTEWGVSDNNKNTEIYAETLKKWIKLLNDNNISWINWSFSYKEEVFSFLKPNIVIDDLNIEENLSPTGLLIKELLLN